MAVSSHATIREEVKRECAAESRSTSAGSSNDGERLSSSSVRESVGKHDGAELRHLGSTRSMSSRQSGLPDFAYPVPIVIRNTFIETQCGRPVSLDDFFQERRIHSCPVATPEEECHHYEEAETPPEPEPLRRAITTGAHALMTTVAAATGFWTVPECGVSVAPVENFNAAQPVPRVLVLSEALPEASLGSSEMPTVGSAAHSMGACKPCAFFYTRGCENGAQCSFCHLCGPDEKRRRQKEKQAVFREVRQQQRRQVRL